MKQEFEEWADGKISLVRHENYYANTSAQVAWSHGKGLGTLVSGSNEEETRLRFLL